jgi:phospholipid/cholesterol/gamma-HCH transport system substrate-binding protein
MSASTHRSEIYVGLFVLLGLGLLGWLIFHFGDARGNRTGGYPLIVEVRDATGIRAGVPVRLGGVEIGRVSGEPEHNDNYTLLSIPLTIFEGSKIPAGSTVKVGTSGLMGDSFVRIIPPEVPSGEFLPPGHRILAESSESFSDLAGSAGEALDEVTLTAGEIRAAADQMESLFTKLDRGFLTSTNMENVSVMLAELRASSEHIREASAKLNPLLEETGATLDEISGVADAAKSTLSGVDQSMAGFNETLSAINPVVKTFDDSLKDLSVTLKSANELLELLENGDGLAPALLKDSTLKRDLESFLDKLDRNGLILYPREGGLLRDSTPSLTPSPDDTSATDAERRLFPGPRRQP